MLKELQNETFLFSIAILLFSLTPFEQEQNTPDSLLLIYNTDSSGDESISLSGSMIMNNPIVSQFAGGIKIKAFASKRICSDTNRVNGKNYFTFRDGYYLGVAFIAGRGIRNFVRWR